MRKCEEDGDYDMWASANACYVARVGEIYGMELSRRSSHYEQEDVQYGGSGRSGCVAVIGILLEEYSASPKEFGGSCGLEIPRKTDLVPTTTLILGERTPGSEPWEAHV